MRVCVLVLVCYKYTTQRVVPVKQTSTSELQARENRNSLEIKTEAWREVNITGDRVKHNWSQEKK